MSTSQIRGNKQIKSITIGNDQIANGVIELDKLKEGTELLKRDGSVVATGDFDLGSHNLKNLAAPVDSNDAVRKADLDAVIGGSIVTREVPTGSVNGTNTQFSLINEPNIGTEQVFLNGALLNAGANSDYVLEGSTITFTLPPQVGDAILVNYISDMIVVSLDINTSINQLNSRLTTAEGELFTAQNDITAVEGDVSGLDTRLTTAEADIVAVEGDVASLQTSLSSVQSSVTSVQSSVSSEQAARIAADDALDTAVGSIQTSVTSLGNRMTSAESDVAALEAADVAFDLRAGVIEDGLQAETTARTNADTSLEDSILQEEIRAIDAEVAINTRIDNLRLDDLVDMSVGAPGDKTTLVFHPDAGPFGEWHSEKISYEDILNTPVIPDVGPIEAGLAQEVLDRAADVDAEETRALAAEDALDARIDALEAETGINFPQIYAPITYVDTEVSAEETRALAAEDALDARIDALETAPPPVSALDDLSDVTIGERLPLVSGHTLRYNGVVWENDVDFSGSYTDLTDKPSLFSGSYDDLTNKPTIPSVAGLASETYVDTKVADLVASAPEALNTLNELALALGSDENFSTTVTNALASKADSASLADVATSGDYADLLNKPSLFSGSYSDLTNKPTIPSALDDLSDVAVSSAAKGQFIVHNGTSFVNSRTIEANAATTVPLTIKGATSQSANYLDIKDSANNNVLYIDSAKMALFSGCANFAGGGSGLPSVLIQGALESSYTTGWPTIAAGIQTTSGTHYPRMMFTGNNGSYIDFVTTNNSTNWSSRIWATPGGINIGTSYAGNRGYPAAFSGYNNPALTLAPLLSTAKGLVVQAAASQTANLFEAQNSSGTALFSIDKDGSVAAGTVPVARVSGLATVATSGSYNDLSNKPSIPSLTGYATESYVDSAVAGKADSSSLATVATSGAYADLTGKPTVYTPVKEVLTSLVDGTETEFVLSDAPAVADTEQVFLNGILQSSGATEDYTISGGTITFNTAPEAGWKLVVFYFV